MNITSLRAAIRAGGVVAFTGAGVSEESGIPTYRGTGGFWTSYDPDKYASIDYFQQDPSYFWAFFRDTRRFLIHEAKPNAAHKSLANLEELGLLDAVITQNIDGLHQAAGNKHVVELHGSYQKFSCTKCDAVYPLAHIEREIEKPLPPQCIECDSVIRPDIVFFGEMLPPDKLEKAYQLASQSKLILMIGSSLVVYPAAQVPHVAKQSGARLAIINLEPTPLDDFADWVFHEKAGIVLPELLEYLT
ncbi:NAD-dependent deacylase [bacterium]|nr:NAD-dependent deacylase [bacterium]MBU1652370.1 NAD-dependent deacylase [bacterium]MBU1880387.1 NAD-dependent deacylase [bacterium]